jgi:hypothetical protein
VTTTPSTSPISTPERFDANQVELVGLVTKIWARSTRDVFARISVGKPPEAQNDGSPDQTFDSRLTLLLPAGQIAGRDISLLKGDALSIRGYLSDITLWESLREFLLKARQSGLYERIPELAPAMGVQVKRSLTCVIPEALEVLDLKTLQPNLHSLARLEGLVARVWVYGGHLFTRLAVYDQHTQVTRQAGNHGRPRRIPHYLTVQFPHEQIDGRSLVLKAKQRLRVSGPIGSRVYSENLRTFLISARRADVLAQLSDGQAPDEVWTAYVQTCLVANTLIQYTRR